MFNIFHLQNPCLSIIFFSSNIDQSLNLVSLIKTNRQASAIKFDMNIKLLCYYFMILLWNSRKKRTSAREWKTNLEKLDASSDHHYEIYSTWDDFKVI